jgi:undecaprenyl-diphosphatase
MMFAFDADLTNWVNGWAGYSPAIDLLIVWISTAGVPLLVFAVGAQWWLRDNRRHVRHTLVAAGLSFLLGLALNQIILLVVHRVRPYDAGITRLLIAPSSDPSFPSDHATAAFAVAATFLLHGLRRRGVVFLAFALVIGISRIYIGTHYVSDVLGGAVTGILAAAAVQATYREGTRLDRFFTNIL